MLPLLHRCFALFKANFGISKRVYTATEKYLLTAEEWAAPSRTVVTCFLFPSSPAGASEGV